MSFGSGVSSPGMGPRGAMERFSSGTDERGQIYNPRVMHRMLF